jgi:hypothetical protein
VLLATLNRLQGGDDPDLRTRLLEQLSEVAAPQELAKLLPESPETLADSLRSVKPVMDGLLADLRRSQPTNESAYSIWFRVSQEEKRVIDEAINAALREIGDRERGHGLARVARCFLEGQIR